MDKSMVYLKLIERMNQIQEENKRLKNSVNSLSEIIANIIFNGSQHLGDDNANTQEKMFKYKIIMWIATQDDKWRK